MQAEVASGALSQNNGVRLATMPRAEQVSALAEYKSVAKDATKALAAEDGAKSAPEDVEDKPKPKKAAKKSTAAKERRRIVTEDTLRSRREVRKIREALGELEVDKDLEDTRNHVAAALAWFTNGRVGNSDVSKVFALAEKAAEKPRKAKRA